MKTRSLVLSVLCIRLDRATPPRCTPIAAVALLLGVLAVNGTGTAATPVNADSATTPSNTPSATTSNPGMPGNTGPITVLGNTPPTSDTATTPANGGLSTAPSAAGSAGSTTRVLAGTTDTTQTSGNKGHQFTTQLSGYEEVHFSGGGGAQLPAPAATLRGAISTRATGAFSATLSTAGEIVDYELTYSGLESDITQAHIHFGQRSTVGGIVVWLCQTASAQAPATVRKVTPLCPGARDGSLRGTITADQVLDVADQGISANEFDELISALRAGAAYANVHSQTFPQGEIRGQIQAGEEDTLSRVP
jgi:CHRD domain